MTTIPEYNLTYPLSSASFSYYQSEVMKDLERIRRETQDKINPWLDKFAGMPADDIAAFLKEEGVLAVPGVSSSCAFAAFFRDKVGVDVRVTNYVVMDRDSGSQIAELPQSMMEFVQKFDQMKYPDLVNRDIRRHYEMMQGVYVKGGMVTTPHLKWLMNISPGTTYHFSEGEIPTTFEFNVSFKGADKT